MLWHGVVHNTMLNEKSKQWNPYRNFLIKKTKTKASIPPSSALMTTGPHFPLLFNNCTMGKCQKHLLAQGCNNSFQYPSSQIRVEMTQKDLNAVNLRQIEESDFIFAGSIMHKFAQNQALEYVFP